MVVCSENISDFQGYWTTWWYTVPNTFSKKWIFFKSWILWYQCMDILQWISNTSSYVLPSSLEEQEEEGRVKATLPNTTGVVANFRKYLFVAAKRNYYCKAPLL